ncbi:MAG TPA: carboxypeptidase regulatory-like domain-containing protein [Terriglobales bacterium]|nr:carboxypeptidase regulatory-like domain-containing protein [Terriglobales bacterium]
MNLRRFGWLLATLVLTACLIGIAFAQSTVTGDLTGVVTDSSGAVVPQASVTLTSDANGGTQVSQTNGQGQYRFTLLKPGSYTVRIKASGLANAEVRVNVELGQVTNVPVKIGVAGTTTTLEVTAESPLIETQNANLATTYDSALLAELPTPGGDVTSFAYSSPGVTLNSAAGYGNFSAYGLPSTANLFITNGNDNMDPYLNLNNSGASNLSMGANELQEEAVVSNGYTAQYGRQAGATVSATTKSGSNQFHGNALYWYNGTNLNANDWFGNNTNTPRPHAVNNEWAGSIGGPIIKNKLFFFADYEGLRFVLPGVTGLNYLPSQQFSQYVLANVNTTTPGSLPYYQNIFNLYAAAPGASRAVPVTSADDPNLGCGDFAGTAGFGTTIPCSTKFVSNQNNLNTEWLFTTRIDYNISNSDRLFGRYKHDYGVQSTGTDPISSVFNANSIQPEYEGQLNETHIFNGTTVNQLIVSGSWYSALFSANNLPAALKAFPTTMFVNDGLLTTLGGGDNAYPQGRIVTQYQITDDFSKTKGSHELKFGVNYRRNLVSDYTTGVNTSGALSINSMTEFVQGTGAVNGASDFSQEFTNVGAARIKLYSLGLYAQDQWKATSKLNVTAAIRVDRNANPSCATNCFTRLTTPFQNLTHDPNVPYNQIIKTGQSNAFSNIETAVFSPRIGLAYSLTPNTVIRGGFGLFTDLFPALIIDRFITNAPNVATFDSTGGPIAPNVPGSLAQQDAQSNAAFQAGFANGATLADLQASVPGGFSPPTYNSMGNKLLNPKFLEYNFEVQQQLGTNYSLSLDYVGNHGMDIMTVNPFQNALCNNNCPFGGTITANPPDARFAQIVGLTNSGWSNYNGLTGSFRFRASKSFQGQFNYTWSHDLDTCSNNCLEPFSANTVVSLRYQVSPNLPGTSYGSSDYDVRHLFNANYVYTSKSDWSNRGLNHVLGGWTVAGTIFFHTGYGWSPVSTAVRANLGQVTGVRNGTPLAEFVGTPVLSCYTPNKPCATASEFVDGASQTGFGNYPRNTLRGPNFFDTDLNITKNFKVGERLGLAIGANFFNILNHPNFDLPNNNVPSGNFGQITSTVSPATSPYGAFLSVPLTGRIVQLNARVTF